MDIWYNGDRVYSHSMNGNLASVVLADDNDNDLSVTETLTFKVANRRIL